MDYFDTVIIGFQIGGILLMCGYFCQEALSLLRGI